MRTGDSPPFPLDLAVPILLGPAPHGVDLRSAFLLLHVDGKSSIAEITKTSGLPMREVVRCFNELVTAGAVSLGGQLPQAVPRSGTYDKELFQIDLKKRAGT